MATYLKSMSIDNFNNGTLDLFWQFLCERQEIWARRTHLAMNRPWTSDPVLAGEFITNVYRELDPGTAWIMNIIRDENLSPINKVFNVMIYRIMGSATYTSELLLSRRIRGVDSIVPFTVERYSPELVAKKLKRVPMEDTKFFGDAYRVAGYHSYNSSSKIQNVSMLFADIAKQLQDELFDKMVAAQSVPDLYNAFMSVKGMGEFLAQQCMTDLLYLGDEGNPIFQDFNSNTWVAAGPGAKRGIWHLIDAKLFKPGNLMMVMQWLTDNQETEFERLGLTFPYLLGAGDDEDEPILISVTNIQGCLCEFSKYMRVVLGEGKKGVRHYTTVDSTELEAVPTVLSEDELMGLSDISEHRTVAEPGHRDRTLLSGEDPLHIKGAEGSPNINSLFNTVAVLDLTSPVAQQLIINPQRKPGLPYAIMIVPVP